MAGGWLDQLELMLPQPNFGLDWAELGKNAMVKSPIGPGCFICIWHDLVLCDN